ncbi:MAG TPA: tRNA dihydrouridine synthase DusB [Phycisphaerales bacterium]|nr:tRNA dihydrouridine synthase DusB [Phycisphaerales bacterium]
MHIGPYPLDNRLILAPMAGVTDRPFRQLCRRLGAGLAVSEMVTADSRLWHSRKSRSRLDHAGEDAPRSVQIAGADPAMMAEAARLNVAFGAQIIDVNMGCPAKKVCNRAAGSALLRDEPLVRAILEAVVDAVDVPVTLKIRTGWDAAHRNAPRIAEIAEAAGIQALAVHGRTRACGYGPTAEYDTIRRIKQVVAIPVIANGDIDSGEKAKHVLEFTGADAIMIGRGAQGNPWIFREIAHYLDTGSRGGEPAWDEVCETLLDHVQALHAFYGEVAGLRIARKHIGWYLKGRPGGETTRQQINRLDSASEQLALIAAYFESHHNDNETLAA